MRRSRMGTGMRLSARFLASVTAAATMIALTTGPAFADPPSGVTPRPTDAVSSGSDSTQYLLDQLSYDFDHANPKAATKLYSWDAVNPDTLVTGDTITTKAGCAAIARPDGSGAGVAALEANARPSGNSTNYCLDYARSSRARESTDPSCATNGICFVSLAGDAVTWADRSAAAGGTDAPGNLTTAQLVKIYECSYTNWDQVGGENAPIQPFLPQTSSGTRTFFLTALGGGVTPITPGSCVSDGAASGEPEGTIEENEGINAALDTPEAIFPFSIGSWLSQEYHSPACTYTRCTPNATGDPCPLPPGSTLNMFGCNETGVLQLNQISDTCPIDSGGASIAYCTSIGPPCPKCVINPDFDAQFQRTLYDVVRYDPDTADHIPGGEPGSPGGINLEQFFGASGYVCSASEQAAIMEYGYEPTWKLSACGAVS
jgi:ABC-type phosphate transport system substrate-binding protein